MIPVYGVWFEGWNASQIFLVYCLETVIIGIFNVAKMLIVNFLVPSTYISNTLTASGKLRGLFYIIFFIFHYGIFVFVQTQIFFSVSGIINTDSIFGSYAAVPEALGHDGKLLLLIFVAYYTLHSMYNFIVSVKNKTVSLSRLMIQPYGRIFVQQFVVILGSMFLVFSVHNIFILILATIKFSFELFF